MPKRWICYSFNKAQSQYHSPLQMLYEALQAVKPSNTKLEELREFQAQVKAKIAYLRKRREIKKHQKKAGKSLHDEQYLAAVAFAREHGMHWKEALKIIKECWPDEPVWVPDEVVESHR
jgi:hypothetical protein